MEAHFVSAIAKFISLRSTANLHAVTAAIVAKDGRLSENLRAVRHVLEAGCYDSGFKEVLVETIVHLATMSRVDEAKSLVAAFGNELGTNNRFEAGVQIALRAADPSVAIDVLALETWRLTDAVMTEAVQLADEAGSNRLARSIASLISRPADRRRAAIAITHGASHLDQMRGY